MRYVFASLLLCAAQTSGLLAGDKLRYGAQVGLSKPLGDLKRNLGHSIIAPEAGLWLSWRLSPHLTLRSFVDYQRFLTAEEDFPHPNVVNTFKGEWKGLSMGIDSCVHLPKEPIYLIAGVGITAWNVKSMDTRVYTTPTGMQKITSSDDSGTYNGLFASLGVGYQVANHLATEGRMTFGNYRKQQAFNHFQWRFVVGF